MNKDISTKELAQLLHNCGTGKCSDACPYVNTDSSAPLLSCGDRLMQDASEALARQQWISVDARKPDAELDAIIASVPEAARAAHHWAFQCLAVVRGATAPTILNYADIDGDRVWVDDEGDWYPVTHWMPLPRI